MYTRKLEGKRFYISAKSVIARVRERERERGEREESEKEGERDREGLKLQHTP